MADETPSIPATTDRKRIARRISWPDAEAIAEMVAYRMTEAEAALQIGIQPKQWYDFKNRAKRLAKFDELVTRIRGGKIASNLAEIKKAATGSGGVRHDWRAADRMIAIAAPERYAQASQTNVTVNNQTAIVGTLGGSDQLAKLVAMYCDQAKALQPAKPVIDCPPKVNDDKQQGE